MDQPKPFASLSPGLLARKGAAKPAMRPQITPLRQFHEATARQMEEDLGWNDMGHDVEAPAFEHPVFEPAPAPVIHEAEIVPINAELPLAPIQPAPSPVAEARAEIAERIAPAPVAARKAVSRKSALEQGRRAAFTLRLDAERHLKLRLACTVEGRSAQQLVLDAVDQLLERMPEIEALAAQVRKRK